VDAGFFDVADFCDDRGDCFREAKRAGSCPKEFRSRGSLSAAQQAQHNEDYATAEREYVAVLALAPEFAEVHMNLGLVYQLEDRSADAMTEFAAR